MIKSLARVPISTWIVLALFALALVWRGWGDRRGGDPEHRDDGHGHDAGLHGGIVAALGDDHHAELIVEEDGRLLVFILDKDERRVTPIESQTLEGYLHSATSEKAAALRLHAAPRAGDPPGMTSRFAGEAPAAIRGGLAAVTLPEVFVGGRPYRVRLALAARPEETMPAGLATDEARRLYLTPGGLYTAGDIAANGKLTALEKYHGFRARHDFMPEPGDPICPITRTKANPECFWIVGGRRYTFCCPPCIDEFVTMAKAQPERIKQPEDYAESRAD